MKELDSSTNSRTALDISAVEVQSKRKNNYKQKLISRIDQRNGTNQVTELPPLARISSSGQSGFNGYIFKSRDEDVLSLDSCSMSDGVIEVAPKVQVQAMPTELKVSQISDAGEPNEVNSPPIKHANTSPCLPTSGNLLGVPKDKKSPVTPFLNVMKPLEKLARIEELKEEHASSSKRNYNQGNFTPML